MKKEKALIFDAGSLITLSMTGLLDIIYGLKKEFNGKFLIPEIVESEMITRPKLIKKYKLGALRLQKLLDDKVIECADCLGIDSQEIKKRTDQYLDKANNLFFKGNHSIHLIDKGEAACLALSSILTEKNIENIIVIDEKTTRMLGEKPENLRQLMEKKLHTKIISKPVPPEFKNFSFIRSSELVYIAYKKGLFKNAGKEMLDALLWAVKFKGCSINNDEISALENL